MPAISVSFQTCSLALLVNLKERAGGVSVVDGFGKPGTDFIYTTEKHLNLVGLTWNMILMVELRAELGRDKAEENRPNSLMCIPQHFLSGFQ